MQVKTRLRYHLTPIRISSVQFSRSVMSSSLPPHGPQHTRLPCPSPTPELAQTYVHQVGDAIQPSHPLSSPSPPTFNLSQHQGLFKWVSSLNQVAEVLSFSFSISPSNEYSGMISFRMDSLLEWLLAKRSQMVSVGKDVEKREPSYTVSGNVNWYNHYRKQYGGC